jgi:hypothetical protein
MEVSYFNIKVVFFQAYFLVLMLWNYQNYGSKNFEGKFNSKDAH